MQKYCENCKDRIQGGKVYSKKNIDSAWYIVIDIVEDKVYYRKMNVVNIKFEKDVGCEMKNMNISEFKELFKHETTIFCNAMIYNVECLRSSKMPEMQDEV